MDTRFMLDRSCIRLWLYKRFQKLVTTNPVLTVENCESKILSFMRALDVLSSDVNDEDDKYGYSNLLVARAGVASSRAEDLIAKKDN
mmetsp:Transcript_40606/g.41180  ORF Transcript_40606/g.41180 Transcript_40606/m.41180 type:complete len:87 (+) Transcript_40606:285-545(+)